MEVMLKKYNIVPLLYVYMEKILIFSRFRICKNFYSDLTINFKYFSYYINSFVYYNTITVIMACSITTYCGVMTMDIGLTTESGTYLIIFAYVLLILSCQKIKSNNLNYYSLQRVLKEDFEYVSTTKPSHRYITFIKYY